MNTTEIIITAIVAVFLVGISIYIKGFKNWLIWAVSEAEAELGSGTGQLKLRFVYDMAVTRFPTMAKLIPFSMFSKFVDAALDAMRQMIENNVNIKHIISGGDENGN